MVRSVFNSGSSREIGFGIAKRFVWAGQAVTITGRDAGQVEAARQELAEVNPAATVVMFHGDLTDLQGSRRALHTTRSSTADSTC